MSKRILSLAAALLVAYTSAAIGAWNTLEFGKNIDGTVKKYTWRERAYPNDVIDDVIHFTKRYPNGTRIPHFNSDGTPNPDGFRDQTIANSHVQYDDNGDWLIVGYGDDTFKDTDNAPTGDDIADAIYVFRRHVTDGTWTINRTPIMQFPTGSQPLGFLGEGAGIAKTTYGQAQGYAIRPTIAGYKFFAITTPAIPSESNPSQSQKWLTWAVSQDGVNWAFLNSTGTGTTTDARQSYRLVTNTYPWQDFNGTYNGAFIGFYHTAMVYNPIDGYFYAIVGYSNACGIKGTWWRFKFDDTQSFGLAKRIDGSFDIEVLERDQSLAFHDMSGDQFVDTNGRMNGSTGWNCNAQSPRVPLSGTLTGPADPMDIVQLYKQDNSLESTLFIYAAEHSFDASARPFYVKGSLPTGPAKNFTWNAPQAVDTTPLTTAGYSDCGAGGGFYFSVNQWGWDAAGNPDLYGHVATWKHGQHPDAGNCGYQWQGLLPVKVNLQ